MRHELHVDRSSSSRVVQHSSLGPINEDASRGPTYIEIGTGSAGGVDPSSPSGMDDPLRNSSRGGRGVLQREVERRALARREPPGGPRATSRRLSPRVSGSIARAELNARPVPVRSPS